MVFPTERGQKGEPDPEIETALSLGKHQGFVGSRPAILDREAGRLSPVAMARTLRDPRVGQGGEVGSDEGNTRATKKRVRGNGRNSDSDWRFQKPGS